MTAPAHVASYEIPRGTVLGKYEILRRLAIGGMAEIYVARVRGTAGFEKLVVLKRILPNVASDPAFVQMFLDEARLAATLQHPNIADVYDVGEVDGTYFFTMEYVHGEDARSIRAATRKRGERPPLAVALAIVQGTAAALDYAHEKAGPDGPLGLVHRDISSSNILVSYDGAVKLVDFGIARATERETKTRTGTLKGKIPYMSPEQCRGHVVDRRSDLFSLGTVLFELTVGRRPFRGDSDFEIMDQIVNHDVQRPTQIDPAYPRELETIVCKLLARDVRARYQSADHLLHDLEELTQTQRLWASAKTIGRYMRTLFADKIAAWESAEREGVTLGQHVQQTITAESQRSELLSPPSTLQALPPAAIPITGNHGALAPSAVMPAAVAPSAGMPAAGASNRRGLVIALTALVTLAFAGAAYWLFVHRATPAAEPAATASPAPPGETVEGTSGAGAPTASGAPAALSGAAAPGASSGAVAPGESAASSRPGASTPGAAASSRPGASTAPGASAAKQPPMTTPTVKKQPTATKPAATTTPAKKPPVKKPPAKKPPVKKPPAEKKKPADEEKPWDPNSPFLPPS